MVGASSLLQSKDNVNSSSTSALRLLRAVLMPVSLDDNCLEMRVSGFDCGRVYFSVLLQPCFECFYVPVLAVSKQQLIIGDQR